MDIQTAIDGLEKEREEIGKENCALLDIIFHIQDTLSDVPACHKEWKNHPATKYFADKLSQNRKKSAQLYKAIKDLKAIIK